MLYANKIAVNMIMYQENKKCGNANKPGFKQLQMMCFYELNLITISLGKLKLSTKPLYKIVTLTLDLLPPKAILIFVFKFLGFLYTKFESYT